MKRLALFAALALIVQPAGAAPSHRSLAEDVAEIATRVCAELAVGRLRWNPADFDQEKLVLEALGLQPGIPSGIIDSFGPNTASTFNQSVLAYRRNGTSHILVAMGGMVPGCRVTVAGAPGSLTAAQVSDALARPEFGWSAAPEFDRREAPIARRTFVRPSDDESPLRLDVLEPTEPHGTFRLMAMMFPKRL